MVTPLRVLFFGTPAFAVPSLQRLLDSAHQVVAVVTQPDHARGRGQKVVPQAVKALAVERGVPVLQPESLRDPAVIERLRSEHADLGVVAAYGKILPAELLALPRLGMINVHSSMLPRWRGAAPVHRAVLAGDARTGVTIMRVVQALDAGPILDLVTTPIDRHETSDALERRLAIIGGDRLLWTIDRMANGVVDEIDQDAAMVTYAPKLDRRESPVDWSRPAVVVHNQIRGLQPWPMATSTVRDRRIILLESVPDEARGTDAAPGTILAIDRDGIAVAAQPGVVRLLRVQPEGRAAMSARDFANGARLAPGEIFR